MAKSTELLQKIYDASNHGLDIITDIFPEALSSEGKKKKFRLRTGEKTPSAWLKDPSGNVDYYRVIDYGGGEGERCFSPIDLYMHDRGYDQQHFALALHELMEKYGVSEELNRKVNKPDITRRDATDSETGQPPRVRTKQTFSNDELATWGPRVKPEHLKELGWASVTAVETTKDDVTTIKKPTEHYPIFVETCDYIDEQGIARQFQKVYEPKNFNKAYRFFIIGRLPQNYIFGLNALRRKFQERGEEKLPEVVIVSGGSDAVNCLSMGFQPVWLSSETADLREEDLKQLQKYARRIILIPDIDATGRKTAQRLALRFPQLYIAWLTPEDMGRLHDNRRRARKDLKDFIQLHPHREDMQRLIDRAVCTLYWTKTEDKDGNTQYTILPARLNYYLAMNGFYTLKDDTRKEPLYIFVNGAKVRRIVAKTIVNFLMEQAKRDGLDEALQNKLMRCRDLPTDHVSHLQERDDLDFTKCTAETQKFFFRNGWTEVTAEGIKLYRYSDLDGSYVWEDAIIDHDYRAMTAMFKVEKLDNGGYGVDVPELPPSKFFQMIVNTSRLHWRKADEGGLALSEEEQREEHQCLASKLACIGYLLFGYKSEAEAWAPICQDSKLAESEDECNGGSGKSLFLKAVSRLLNMFYIDAHVPSIVDNRFLFDGVTEDTDLIIVDECDRRLNFDFFFGRITGDMKGEEKGNHPFQIPFARSPKIAFATNYVLRKHDASTERRIWPQVFSDYYHEATRQNDYRESRSIRDDLGCNLMGSEHAEKDWQADIAFMLQCLQFYLSLPKGERRIMPPLGRIGLREQMAAVGKDFKQWADEFLVEDGGNLDCELKAEDMLAAFNAETRYGWSPKKFAQHLKAYCDMAPHIHCLNPATKTGKKKNGERWQKHEGTSGRKTYYYIESELKYTEDSKNAEPEEQVLLF
jgi:5S rRNA maturation endonuclease (ribonuclease M5)